MSLDDAALPVPVVRRIADLRAIVARWKEGGDRIGFVPTMGALHEGHLSLVKLARRYSQRVIVSIFVNPTQFAPQEDFARYPRMERSDAQKLADAHTDLLFSPDRDEMYGMNFATTISVSGPALGLESDFRPHFFSGVATVVTKLLNQCTPHVAVFGEKDYQQLAVIRRLVSDLDLPIEIIGAPTLRETDGLAMSSRNMYLTAQERAVASRLNVILSDAAEKIRNGGNVEAICAHAGAGLLAAGFSAVDYVAVRDAETFGPFVATRSGRLLAAAWLGQTRLIDNLPV
jgi:pantoate--beta-alanine ligase